MKKLLILLLISLVCFSLIGCNIIPTEVLEKLGISTDSFADDDTVTVPDADKDDAPDTKPDADSSTTGDNTQTPDEEETHTHIYTAKVTKPTCVADGYTTHTCTCGDSYTDSTTSALGHKPDSSSFDTLFENEGALYVRAACGVCAKGYDLAIDEISDFTLTKENKGMVSDIASGEIYIPAVFTSEGKWYKIVAIGNKAFSDNMNITAVTVPDTVTSISDSAFYGCVRMATVTLPDTMSVIGNDAFYFCQSLTAVTLPSNLISIGENAFRGCTSLKDVTLPEKLESIGTRAFSGCQKISKLPIPAGVKTIGAYAFENCSITVFIGGKNLESIGEGAYSGCKINTIFYEGTKSEFKAITIATGNSNITSPMGPTFYYSETKSSGCWRYVNGSPTPW